MAALVVTFKDQLAVVLGIKTVDEGQHCMDEKQAT